MGAILRRDCPRQLYKYFAPERWGFLADLRIRYSQLGSFNDPFEGRPEITSLTTQEDVLAMIGRVLPEEMESAYSALPRHVQATIPWKQVFLLAEHLAASKQGEMLAALESITPHAASFITGKIDQVLGVLCLSEVPDSLLMWAHYCSSHTGFVVEFEGWHPSFHEQKSDEDDLRHIRRVHYRESRPSAPLTEMSAIELFLVKSGHWTYEREWRIVRPLVDAATTVEEQPYPIALFDVTADSIKRVILGARMKADIEANIRQAMRANPGMSSVKVQRAVPDGTNFLLRFVE